MPEERDNQIERRQAGDISRISETSQRGTDATRFIQGLAKKQTGDLPRHSASPGFKYGLQMGLPKPQVHSLEIFKERLNQTRNPVKTEILSSRSVSLQSHYGLE